MIVDTATTAPVIELSCWVTPCWTRSPRMTRMISSNADMAASSLRPMARRAIQRKKNMIEARTTICI